MTGLPNPTADCVVGCLLGTAVGDAMGVPYESLSRRRQARMFPDISGHRFLFRRGMVSDDTEHTCFVAQALIASAGNPQIFSRELAWRLRWWLAGLPAATGLATARAVIKLWTGFPPERSGVFSAGNGPAMRSALLGVCYGHDVSRLRALVHACTRITHTDPKSEWAALAVAIAASLAAAQHGEVSPGQLTNAVAAGLESGADAFLSLLADIGESAARGENAAAYCERTGLAHGVSGYALHTVPVALQIWLRRQNDYRGAVLEAIRCGGDTDTLAAIVGGIVGAHTGKAGIPAEWLDGLCDWPRTTSWIEQLGITLASAEAEGSVMRPPRLFPPALLLRNVVFLAAVLAHGARRIFPPYDAGR